MEDQEQRRHYPKDRYGAKSEWYGMENHLKDIGDEINRNEKEILMLRKKELLTELDKKVLEQLHQKQRELEFKQFEAEEMLRRKQLYDEEQRQFNEDRALLQKSIQHIYDKQKQDGLMREMDQRRVKLEWERQALEENRQRMESEGRRRKVQKDLWAKEQIDDLKLAEIKHNDQRQKYMIDQLEIQELHKRNAERELIKEENYRNFYRMCADNQANLQRMHIDNVMQPLLERQAQLEAMISKNMDAYQKKLLMDELDRVMKRQNEYQSALNANKQIISEHEQFKEYQKAERGERNKQRLEDLNNYNTFLVYKKQEQVDKQKEYKVFLDRQRQEKDEQKLQQQRMGRGEKMMNMLDLQSYKKADPSLSALIPGYSHQVGQLPPKQNLMTRKNQSLLQLKQDEQNLINQNLSAIGQDQYRGMALRGAAQNTITPQGGVDYNQSHNPLTNPTPFNNQNPYIRKQFNEFLQHKQPTTNSGRFY